MGVVWCNCKGKDLVCIGPRPWSATAERAADGSSAALLAAGWLRIVPLDTPKMKSDPGFSVQCPSSQRRYFVDGWCPHCQNGDVAYFTETV